MKKDLEMII